MRKLLLTSVACIVLATPALAADLRRPAPMKAPPPPPPIALFSWTGCYIGGHVGGVSVTKDWHFRHHDLEIVEHHHGEHDADGWLAGIQGGCDYQFGGPAGGFVIGIAADYAWANADGEHDRVFDFVGENARFRSEVDSVASITARFGWAIDRFLVYVKGGFAWERDKFHVRLLEFADEWEASDTRTGWTVGIGAEYAFTNWVSAFVEANWYKFDDDDITFNHRVVDCCDPFHPRWKIEEEKFVIKGGINFRFGGLLGGAPVAARY
jgi:outer membrane immunogenic protein